MEPGGNEMNDRRKPPIPNPNYFHASCRNESPSPLTSPYQITLKFVGVCYKLKVETSDGGGNLKRMICGDDKSSTATIHEKTILNGVTGVARPGEILAILGPSGSGKSTLLNALAGRLHGHHLTGSILADDKKLTKSTLKRIGFVTQDDVFYPHLTVRETLIYCALLRLPNTLLRDAKISIVDSVITELGLSKCGDTIIGNTFIRGVSGGERKRVSIAHEMLVNPSLLILDEPTSGLDSTAAHRLVSTLEGLARKGRKTVVTSVHQPSSRVFQMFDSVLVLCEGRPIYFGKGSEAMTYFESVGFSTSFPMNPADFLLDLANDDCLLFTRATVEEGQQVLDILNIYEKISGQKVNVEKSAVSFGQNVEMQARRMLQQFLGFKMVDNHGRYLGMPSFIGKSRRLSFDTLLDRMRARLQGWKDIFLSKGGKEIMLKAVIQTLPTFFMQCFKIPVSICTKMDEICRRFWWGSEPEKGSIAWIKWSRLCEPKFNGGLGFRCFTLFNKALLAKQVWRIVTIPHSLVARVLKARYFPKEDFWTARLKGQPSYTWRSLVGARDVLGNGTLWKIGDGSRVNIWGSKWLPNSPGHLVPTGVNHLPYDALVKELIDPERGEWRRELLQLCFNREIVREILSIPISARPQEDVLIWRHAKDGIYSVKSAYRILCRDENERLEGGQGPSRDYEGQWMVIWKAAAAPKVKHCVWRAAKDALATRTNLTRRIGNLDPRCPLCGEDYETITHLMLDCTFASAIWRMSPFRLITSARRSGWFGDWVLEFLGELDVTARALAMTYIWAIWGARNGWIFNRILTPPLQVSFKAMQYHTSVLNAQLSTARPTALGVRPKYWTRPSAPYAKVNVDAAAPSHDHGGFGIVVRDEMGCCLGARQVFMDVPWEPEAMEAGAIRAGMIFARELNLQYVLIESDCLNLTKALEDRRVDRSTSSNIITDCLSLIPQFISVKFVFTPRTCNSAAHFLAQKARTDKCQMTWQGCCPGCIVTLIEADAAASCGAFE